MTQSSLAVLSNRLFSCRAVALGLVGVLVLFLGVTPAHAQQDQNDPALDIDTSLNPYAVTFMWDNDGGLIRPGGTDRHYTNGLLATLAHQPALADQIVKGLGLNHTATAVGYHVGQLMFTPKDITRLVPDPSERSYAGYLFGGFYFQREQGNQLDHLQFDVGLVGPRSGAEDLQTGVHRVANGKDPEGWDGQLEDDFTYQFTYRKKWRILLDSEEGNWMDTQLIPQIGFSVGNVYRQAEAAATLRIGTNLPDDFGPGRVNDIAAATGMRRTLEARQNGARKWGWYAYGKAGVRYVEHNLFLDGPDRNTGPDTTVESEPVVGEFSAGIHAYRRFSNNWGLELGFAQTLLTDEFRGQDTLDGYGSLLVAVRATW